MTASSAAGPGWRPRLRNGVVIARAEGERWQVRWDFDEVLYLSGESAMRVLPWLVPCLDGQNVLADLEHRAAESGSAAAFREIIDYLGEQRLLDDAGIEPAWQRRSELFDAVEALGIGAEPVTDAEYILQKLATAHVVVRGTSRLARCIAASARAQGFANTEVSRPDEALPDAALPVAVETDHAPEGLERLNAWALAGRHPWMLVGAWNRRVLVGPIFVPGETACFVCHRKRLDSHRAHFEAYQMLDAFRRTQTTPAPPEPILPALAELAAAHTAIELFNFTTGISQARTVGRVLVYQPLAADLTIESVLKIPWCPVCSP